MPKKSSPSTINQTAIGDGNVQVAGDGNTVNVNQTIIQKFFNIFKSDAETTEQRNRRIMLNHVENFWVKGFLEKSLHGVALLELGIKQNPEALKYPWAIRREPTKQTLPAGTSMLEIFQEIGMGRSLLILGAPGSGKTTMLLELTRQLIERARQDVTEPIPVVFNLSSWTEKLTLADWLARELNVIYTIPKKVAPTWVKENKMLLLLDGLDEVRQENRDKCVDAINQFRKENGLTSMAVCSRIQDYAELKTRLSFDGAIEIQPLTLTQVNDYFKRFGNELAGIRQVLEKDTTLREMAETPLFLSIMTLAYRDTPSKDILVSENFDTQRKHLFDTYIEHMFERPRLSKGHFKKQDVLYWLSWLAYKIIEHNAVPYLFENMQPNWLSQKKQGFYRMIFGLMGVLIFGPVFGLIAGLFSGLSRGLIWGLIGGLSLGLIGGLSLGLIGWSMGLGEIEMVDTLTWDWKQGRKGLIFGLIVWLIVWLIFGSNSGLTLGLLGGLSLGLFYGLANGLNAEPISQTTYSGQRISFSIRNFLFVFLLVGLISCLVVWVVFGLDFGLSFGLSIGLGIVLFYGLMVGLMVGLKFGGLAVTQHYSLRFIIAFNKFLPWRLIPFLNYCTERIFLRKVGGGYIFVHRLLMEHFAAMYSEE